MRYHELASYKSVFAKKSCVDICTLIMGALAFQLRNVEFANTPRVSIHHGWAKFVKKKKTNKSSG